MAKFTETFRLIAIDETDSWNVPEVTTAPAFGIYFYREHERTHICSLMPSSRAEWLENRFHAMIGLESESPLYEKLAELERENSAETTTYLDFIRSPDPRRVSDPVTIEIDGDDYDLPAGFDPKESHYPEAMLEAFWEAARESFSCGGQGVAIADSPEVYAAYTGERTRKADDEELRLYGYPRLPLFQWNPPPAPWARR